MWHVAGGSMTAIVVPLLLGLGRLWVLGLLSFAAVPFFRLAFSIRLAACNGAYAH